MLGEVIHIGNLKPDKRNTRKHTPRNIAMIERALNEVGAARSIVIDEEGTILAGNGVIEAAANAGIERVQVVDADGETIIAVRRKGLTPEQKIKLALYDNRANDLSSFDPVALVDLEKQFANLDLTGLWYDEEWKQICAQAEVDSTIDTGDVNPVLTAPLKTVRGGEESSPDAEIATSRPLSRDDKKYHFKFVLSYDDALLVSRALEEWCKTGQSGEAWLVKMAGEFLKCHII